MADNITLPGTAAVVATDDVGGVQYQVVKLDLGGNGLSVPVADSIPTHEPPLVVTGQAAQTAIVNNILTTTAGTAGTSVSGFRCASVQVVSTGTAGTYIFEQSNDSVNWIALPVFNAALVTGVPITAAITATASAIIYTFPLRCLFVRLRIVSTITGGSVQTFSRFSTDPWTPSAALVASNTAGNMLTTATVTGYPTAAASASSKSPLKLLSPNFASPANK